MQIIQITASATSEGHEIFGLGDDQQVYYWDYKVGEWKLSKANV